MFSPKLFFFPYLCLNSPSHGVPSATSGTEALGAFPVGLSSAGTPSHQCQPGNIYECSAEPGTWCADVSRLAQLWTCSNNSMFFSCASLLFCSDSSSGGRGLERSFFFPLQRKQPSLDFRKGSWWLCILTTLEKTWKDVALLLGMTAAAAARLEIHHSWVNWESR